MDEANVLILVVAVVVLFVFFLPSLIAFERGNPRRVVILIANVAIGWTGIGWLAVLAVAVWPRNDALPVRLIANPPSDRGGSGPAGDPPPIKGGGSGPPGGDPVSRLTDLAELKRAGVLSDAEFERKKQEILSA